jgi:hypothetical protein
MLKVSDPTVSGSTTLPIWDPAVRIESFWIENPGLWICIQFWYKPDPGYKAMDYGMPHFAKKLK